METHLQVVIRRLCRLFLCKNAAKKNIKFLAKKTYLFYFFWHIKFVRIWFLCFWWLYEKGQYRKRYVWSLWTEVMMDSISRMVPGVLSNQESGETESFAGNLLEYPQYSRPEEWHGKKVPEVLMSGHHANIEKWRREQSIIRTARRRPDLLKKADLTNKEWNFVRQLKKQWKEEESKDENI